MKSENKMPSIVNFNAFGLSSQSKEITLQRIDRCCSLYYIIMGSLYNVCQSVMVDASERIKKVPTLYRHDVKHNIKLSLAAYDTWNSRMRAALGERYQLWLDITDSVDDEMRRLIGNLFYSIDNVMLSHNMPHSKIAAHMETARIILDIAVSQHDALFEQFNLKTGVNIRPFFHGGDFRGVLHTWKLATKANLKNLHSEKFTFSLNDDANISLAVKSILNNVTNENIYNRAGEYGLRLNPDTWKYTSKEDRMRLKKGMSLTDSL